MFFALLYITKNNIIFSSQDTSILTLSYRFVFMQVVGSSASSTENANEIYFVFRKQCFIFSAEKNTFCKLPYPTKETFGYYLKSTGHGSEAKVASATDKWGRNV